MPLPTIEKQDFNSESSKLKNLALIESNKESLMEDKRVTTYNALGGIHSKYWSTPSVAQLILDSARELFTPETVGMISDRMLFKQLGIIISKKSLKQIRFTSQYCNSLLNRHDSESEEDTLFFQRNPLALEFVETYFNAAFLAVVDYQRKLRDATTHVQSEKIKWLLARRFRNDFGDAKDLVVLNQTNNITNNNQNFNVPINIVIEDGAGDFISSEQEMLALEDEIYYGKGNVPKKTD